MSKKMRYKDDFEGLCVRHNNFSRPGNAVSEADLKKYQPISNSIAWKFYNSGRNTFDRLGLMLEDVQSIAHCHVYLFLKDFSFQEPDRTKIMRNYLTQRMSGLMVFAKRKVKNITENYANHPGSNDDESASKQDFFLSIGSSHNETPEDVAIYLEECNRITSYMHEMQTVAMALANRWIKNNPEMFRVAKINAGDLEEYHKHVIINYANKYNFVSYKKPQSKNQFRAYLADHTHKLAGSLAKKTESEVRLYINEIKRQNDSALNELFEIEEFSK